MMPLCFAGAFLILSLKGFSMVKTQSTETTKAIETMTAQLLDLPAKAIDAKYRVLFGESPSPTIDHAERCEAIAVETLNPSPFSHKR